MRFKVDENIPREAAHLLRAAGYDADTVVEEGLTGANDATIAHRLKAERRALPTLDLDFSDLRSFPPDLYHGIVVIRTRRLTKPRVMRIIESLVGLFETEALDGRLWIVDEAHVRIRG